MQTAYFPSRSDADVIELELLELRGGYERLRFLVDSGFTGRSGLILPHTCERFIHAEESPGMAHGAITGRQRRAMTVCRVSALPFQRAIKAVITDTSVLRLPIDVDGVAGLTFLRHFDRWGAERVGGGWRFFLATQGN